MFLRSVKNLTVHFAGLFPGRSAAGVGDAAVSKSPRTICRRDEW